VTALSLAGKSQANDQQRPWRAVGKVTDKDGKPLAGVNVVATTGYGTLVGGGSTTTGADGKFELHFGAGIGVPKDADGMQCAIISARLPGHFEANLSRQGNHWMARRELTEAERKHWKTDNNTIILPGRPIELNFVMLPAARVSGKLVGEDGQPLAKYSVALVGPELPPGHSVLTSTEADEQGRFTLEDIPTTNRFQFVVRRADPKPPWDDSWASAALTFLKPEAGDFRATFADREIRLQEFVLRVSGDGLHDRKAVPVAGNRGTLNLTSKSEILERNDKLLSVKSAVLTLSNSPPADSRKSLVQEKVPSPRASDLKFKLARTVSNQTGEFKILFENPRGMDLKAGTHQAIVRVTIGKRGTKEYSTTLKQLEIQQARYEIPVTIPAAQVDDSKVSITFVTKQPEHDAWVKSFFQEGKGGPYSGIWTAEAATIPAIPVGK
jgi:hypothetical protein